MSIGRPTANPATTAASALTVPDSATVATPASSRCAPIVWMRTLDYRAPSEHLGRRLSYSPVRPAVSRSWRMAIDGEAPAIDRPTRMPVPSPDRPLPDRPLPDARLPKAPLPDTSTPSTSTPSTPRPSADDELRRLYKWGGRFSVGLIEMRRRFGGDLDQYLIYMIVMLAELAHRRAANPPSGDGRANAPPAPNGLNAFSIAEITCIPRETVRRKLRIMGDAGHIRRGADGLYYPGPSADLERFSAELNTLL